MTINYWQNLTPLQRIIVAVLRAAILERANQRKAKERFEEAMYGRP